MPSSGMRNFGPESSSTSSSSFTALQLGKQLLHILEHQVSRLITIDLLDQVERLVVIDNGHGVVHKGLEAFLQTLLVIVRSIAAQSPPQTPRNTHLLAAIQDEHELEVDLLRHLLRPSV